MYPSHFLFLLIPEFSLYGLVPAIEALRIANQNSEATLFRWHLVSVDGLPVRASCGMTIEVEGRASSISDHGAVVVCAGNHPLRYADRKTLNWLTYVERHGKTLMSIDSGSFILAEAGLLNGYRATVHSEVLPLFQETYPEVFATEALFITDRNRTTCAGGIAALDLMLHIIQTLHGHELAHVVASGFVHVRRHEPKLSGVPSSRIWDASGDRRIQRVIKLMEEHIQVPIGLKELAEKSHQSTRQLERTVHKRFGLTPSQLYARIRLDAARVHLFHGKLRVKEIADLCGFASASTFCRAFRDCFGASPLEYRRHHEFQDLERFRGADTFARIPLASLTPEPDS